MPTSRIGLISAAATGFSSGGAADPGAGGAVGAAHRDARLCGDSVEHPAADSVAAMGIGGVGLCGVVVFSAMRYPAYLTYSMEMVPPNWRGVLSGSGEMAGGLSFAAGAGGRLHHHNAGL